ncbi:MAG TPA: hypothetical protein VMB34_28650 [Acetobacteraceae bacterium]|nr:hypothetical protein [Acetobacteraceae bacterium]
MPGVTFSYFNSRNRRHAFNFLMSEFRRSGITKAELAVRTGKSKAQISRLLGQPSNLTTDTMGELLFAMSGEELEYSGVDPFKHQAHQQVNYVRPQRLVSTPAGPVFEYEPIGASGGAIVPITIEINEAMAA